MGAPQAPGKDRAVTTLLLQRCDPYGIESKIRLAGGRYPENMMGRYVWYCQERAIGRYRMTCRGGVYGMRRAPDGGLLGAHECAGGHAGQEMPLCMRHVREYSTWGYRDPVPLKTPLYDGDGRRQYWTPGSVVGGSRANESCPRCASPPAARMLEEQAEALHQQLSMMQILGLFPQIAKLSAALDGIRNQIDHLRMQGIVHKCPLILREVS